MTGTCHDIRPLLGAYVLGALEPEEAAAVRAHSAPARCARPSTTPSPACRSSWTSRPGWRSPPSRCRRGSRSACSTWWRATAGAAAAASRPVGAPARAPARGGGRGRARGGGDRADGRRRRPRAGRRAATRAAPGYDIALREAAGAAGAPRARVSLESVTGGTTLHLWVRGLPRDPGVVYEVRCDAPGWTASAGTFRADRRGRALRGADDGGAGGEYDRIRVVRRTRAAGGRTRTAAVLVGDLAG